MSDALLLVLSAARAGSLFSVAPQVYAIVGEGGGGSGSSGGDRPDLLARVAGALRAAEKWENISKATVEAERAVNAKRRTSRLLPADHTLYDSLCEDATREANVFADYLYDNFPFVTDDDYDRLVGDCQALLAEQRETAPAERIAEVTEALIPVSLVIEMIRTRNCRFLPKLCNYETGIGRFCFAYVDLISGERLRRRRGLV